MHLVVRGQILLKRLLVYRSGLPAHHPRQQVILKRVVDVLNKLAQHPVLYRRGLVDQSTKCVAEVVALPLGVHVR